MKKKSTREVRSSRRNSTCMCSWAKKGLRSKRVGKQKLQIALSPKEQTVETSFSLLYTHIECNDYIHRGHKKLEDDDVPVCSCKIVKDDPESACGDLCLNFLTSNECTSGFCPCGELCKNQRFQRRRYVNTKLVRTEERGWGLLADQEVKMGEFVIEYCGDVISCEEARIRSQTYELEGLQDAYIISLSGSEFIDATRKGSLGRFINHSCDPNCETRKWTVLGEVRVGIFAKKDIKAGMELTYNYNFEWYGGAKVRCRCGATSCVGFLGAKSRRFQEDTYVWDDNDDRFSVENVPLYDSEDDEPLSSLFKGGNKVKTPGSKSACNTPPRSAGEDSIAPPLLQSSPKADASSVEIMEDTNSQNVNVQSALQEKEFTARPVDTSMKEEVGWAEMIKDKLPKSEKNDERDGRKRKQVASLVVRKRVVTEKLGLSHKKSRIYSSQYFNNVVASHVKAHRICRHLPSKTACEELLAAEEAETAASLELNRLHEQLRPVVEDLGKDGPDNLPITAAEEWIALTCKQLGAVFNFNHAAIKSLSCFSQRIPDKEQLLH